MDMKERKICAVCDFKSELLAEMTRIELREAELDEREDTIEIREHLLETWKDCIVAGDEAVEKRARMNRRVMLVNIATSVILLGLCLVKLFG